MLRVIWPCQYIDPLWGRGNYSATSNIWSWYTGRWWVGCYIWYSEKEAGQAAGPPSPLIVLMYNGPLLCNFNAPIKGLKLIIYAKCLKTLECPCYNQLLACKLCFQELVLNIFPYKTWANTSLAYCADNRPNDNEHVYSPDGRRTDRTD